MRPREAVFEMFPKINCDLEGFIIIICGILALLETQQVSLRSCYTIMLHLGPFYME